MAWTLVRSASPQRGIHFLVVVALLTLLLTTLSNLALWRHLYRILSAESQVSWLFGLTVPVALFCLLYALFLILFSWRYMIKPAFIVLLLSCAGATYAAWSYGTIFDLGLITSMVETNVAEATSYLSVSSVATMVVLGIVPSVLLLKAKIYYPSWGKAQLQRGGAIVVSLIVAVALIVPFYQQYVFIGRNNMSLRKEILPTTYVFYSVRYLHERYFTEPLPYVTLGADARKVATTDKPKLLFLVIGETARAQNFSLLGYERPTNQHTAHKQALTFDIAACGTYTSYSLPCMFGNLKRSGFDPKTGAIGTARDGILQLLHKSGVTITWLENDGGCKGVCQGIPTIEIKPDNPKYCTKDTCWDEVLLKYAAELSTDITQDTIIAFHLIGSHGPRYYERYPERFRRYQPDCHRPDVENCAVAEIVNAYDNTITYTDYVIAQLISILEQRAASTVPMLLYLSDHGESLGENNLYLHAAPYALAPDEQIRVPMQLWLPPQSSVALKLDRACLQGLTARRDFSHDHLFHTMMGLLQVISSEYEPSLDLTAHCPLTAAP